MQHGCSGQATLLGILEEHRQAGTPHALLSCSLRSFNTVLAIHGHDTAEALVAAAQTRLEAACPAGSSIVRLHDEGLAVVIAGASSSNALLELAEQCLQHCRAVALGPAATPLLLNMAIGAALADCTSQQSSLDLVHQALLARLDAERHQGCQVVLAPSQIQQRAAERYQLTTALHCALERDELAAYLQPIVNLSNGIAIGFECLARWPNASGAVASPAAFMHVASDSGIAADIDLQVLRLSLEAAPRLGAAHGSQRPLILSSNISGQLIENPQRVLELLELIRTHPLPRGVQLQLELLEESFNHTAYELDALLEWLSEQHVLIAIDDFGTGYSSLSRLHDLSINTIKIDRSFVQRINAPTKPSNHLVQTLLAVGRDLNLDFTAEGIETETQRQWLLDHGVNHGQGFLFSQPLCLADAIDYLQHQTA